MKFSISEMAKMSGVSVRTLHYYDEIGLLKPSEVVPQTGYRFYNEMAVESLQQVLFYRELDFPLKEILKLMSAPDYNKQDALQKQRSILCLKRKRLDGLIGLLDASLKGDKTMEFNEFDKSEIEKAKELYKKEVIEKWGKTEAYAQYASKSSDNESKDYDAFVKGSDELLKAFAGHIGEDPAAKEVQELVGKWQQLITDCYYDCTKEILAGLGQMYIMDERFTKNMDKFGAGTTKLMSDAIEVYCAD